MKKLLNWLVRAVVLLLQAQVPSAPTGVSNKQQELLAELDKIKHAEPTLFDD